MCGRYKQNADGNAVAEMLRARRRTRKKAEADSAVDEDSPAASDKYGTTVPERYNIAVPGMDLPVVRENAHGRFMDDLYWGFVPQWAQDDKSKIINARAETVAEKPSFRDSFRLRRCVIPADGFVEWHRAATPKIAYDITLPVGIPLPANALLPRGVFCFAGLWDRWTHPQTGDVRDGFALLTIAANAQIAAIHDRMPVILTDMADIDRWLSRETGPEDLAAIAARAAAVAVQMQPAESKPRPAADDAQGSLF